MSFVSTIMGTAERVPLPDAIVRAAIHQLCSRAATRLATGNAESDAWLADEMAARAIAEYSDEPDVRHYELPAQFFARVLGPNRNYSCCFYREAASTLQEAEEEALRHWSIRSGRRNRFSNLVAAGVLCPGRRGSSVLQISRISNSHAHRAYTRRAPSLAWPICTYHIGRELFAPERVRPYPLIEMFEH